MSPPARRRISINLVANVLTQGLNKVFPILAYAYAQRQLGTVSFGHALFAVALVDLTGPIVEAGTTNYGQIAVGRDRDDSGKMRRLLGEILTLRLVNAAFALLALLVAAFTIYDDYRQTVLAVSFMIASTVIDMTYVQTGTQRLWALGLLNVGAKLLILGLLFALVQDPGDATIFAVLLALSNSLYSLGNFLAGTRRWRPTLPSRAELRSAYRRIAPYFLMIVLYYAIERFDYLLVEHFLDGQDVGLYGGTSRVFFSIQALIPAIGLAFGAEMLSPGGERRFARLGEATLIVLGALVLPLAAGAWFAGGGILGLVYDETYQSMSTVFAWLCMSAIPHMLLMVLGYQTLLTVGRIRLVNTAAALGVTIGVGAGLWLVPTQGVLGAAWALGLAKLTAALVLAPPALRILSARRVLLALWPAALATAAMTLALWRLGPAGLWATLATGAAVYAAVLAPFAPFMLRRLRAE